MRSMCSLHIGHLFLPRSSHRWTHLAWKMCPQVSWKNRIPIGFPSAVIMSLRQMAQVLSKFGSLARGRRRPEDSFVLVRGTQHLQPLQHFREVRTGGQIQSNIALARVALARVALDRVALDRVEKRVSDLRMATGSGVMKSSFVIPILRQHELLKPVPVPDRPEQRLNDLLRARPGGFIKFLQHVLLKLALVLDRAQQLFNDLRMAAAGGVSKSRTLLQHVLLTLADVRDRVQQRFNDLRMAIIGGFPKSQTLLQLLTLALVMDRAQQRFNGLTEVSTGGFPKSRALLQHVLLTLALVMDRAQQRFKDLRMAFSGGFPKSRTLLQ